MPAVSNRGLQSLRLAAVWIGAAAGCVLLGAAVTRSPLTGLIVLGGATLGLTWIALGAESVVTLALLTAVGLVPYVEPAQLLFGTVPLWAVALLAAAGVTLATWAVRQRGEPEHAETPRAGLSVTLALVLVVLAYTVVRLLASEPTQALDTTGRILAFSPAAVLGYAMFSQPRVREGFMRAVPLLVAMLVLWGVSYAAAATGQCDACTAIVQSGSEREGLVGDASRLYTSGQDALSAFAVIALALALARPSVATLGLAALGILNIAVQATRAQYLAFACAALVLLAWRFRTSRPSGRVVLALGTAAAFVAIATSPVAERALSGYQELRDSSGNAGYRLRLLDQTSESWSLFGQGVGTDLSATAADFNFDLGLPNTILALGLVGAALQLAVLVAAIGRGVRAGGLAGMSLAAVLTLVLVGRPSLPVLEYGPSGVAYGLVVGAICALPVASSAASRASARWRA